MRSPALAIGWEFRRRHRWGLIAVAGYLFVVATIRFLILEPGEPVLVDSVRFAAVVSVPLTTTFVYLLAVFSFGFTGDLAARHSMYPARMFTLPVTNAALVGWPMLYGTAAVAILWLAARLFAVWPSGIEIPVIWPALLAAALLAWTQALTWMPYGLPGIRLIVAVLCLAALDTVVLLAIHFKAREPMMLAILAPQLPLAYLVARFAVARARPSVVRVEAARPIAAGARGSRSAVRAVVALARQGRAGIRLRNTVSRADHAAVHGRLHGVDGEQAASKCERFLRRARVHRDAAVDQCRAHRRQAADGDVERAGRLAAGAGRHPARARVVGHLVRGTGPRAAHE